MKVTDFLRDYGEAVEEAEEESKQIKKALKRK